MNETETSLTNGEIVPKDDVRIAAMGDIDELVAVLGVLRARFGEQSLLPLQKTLMLICSDVTMTGESTLCRSVRLRLAELKAKTEELGRKQTAFAWQYPGDDEREAFFHLARTVCRRCERSLVVASAAPMVIAYLNNLSLYLYYRAKT